MKKSICVLASLSFVLVPTFAQKGAPPKPGGAAGGGDERPEPPRGPRLQELQSFRVASDGTVPELGKLAESAVASLARLPDGRLMLAHQWFPEGDDQHFEHVAVRTSSDEGATWSKPVALEITGLADGQRQPFGPELVPLPDGKLRLYFIARALDAQGPGGATIGSAISSDGLHFAREPGTRFAAEGKGLIDFTVVQSGGVFHLFAPQMDGGRRARGADGAPPPKGAPGAPGAAPEGGGERPKGPRAFHATSSDGLNFARGEDVELEGAGRWMGSAVADGAQLCFFGTGGGMRAPAAAAGGPPPKGGGVWFATSSDGAKWNLQTIGAVPLADPAAVKLKDGSWLVVGSAGGRNGPPMRGAPPSGAPEGGAKGHGKAGEKPAEPPKSGG